MDREKQQTHSRAGVAEAEAKARQVHAKQRDKGGAPYIEHPLAVAATLRKAGAGDTAISVALLHDVVEDSDTTLNDLRAAGFSDIVLKAVDAITRRENESRTRYLRRVSGNQIALSVKFADLRHNMDLSRIPCPNMTDRIRVLRYIRDTVVLYALSKLKA
jgi:(p)ppGpp synthase/HD superfamily hydrolase